MAGPTSSVLLKAIPDQSMLKVIDAVIDEFATERNGHDFYIKENKVPTLWLPMKESMRPFGYDIVCTGDSEFFYTPGELQAIAAHFGIYPLAEVDIYAMCNGAIDHQYLGKVTLRMAEAVDGLINFGGELPAHSIRKLNGSKHGIKYTTANEETAIYNVSDKEFMGNWLQHEHFRMVK